MKRFFIFLMTSITLAACGGKSVQTSRLDGVSTDTLAYRVINALADSSRTIMEVQDELYALLDSIQERMETCPDEEFRISTKSFTLDLFSALLSEEYCTPEEIQFFLDSIAMRFSDIQSTWYCPTYIKAENEDPFSIPLMTQNVVFRDKWEGDEHVICIDYYDTPKYGETVIITLPNDADYLATIMFNNDSFDNLSEITYSQEDALHVLEHEEGGLSLLFDSRLLESMLENDGMFIGYIGKELNEEHECLFYDGHLVLSKFQEQYRKLH